MAFAESLRNFIGHYNSMGNNKKSLEDIDFSVLDLVAVTEGSTPREAIRRSVNLAQKVEEWNFKRFWISEHHNMESIVSSATSLLLGHVAEATSRIRIGSGGIMLPNHSPLVIAEQFGTLETLYPGRIDLGLGRAPGTDQKTAMALRRHRNESVNDFPNDVQALQIYFSSENRHSEVRAIPGEGLKIPLYLLGSSTYSAQLAGMLGLPYAFASHFAPTHLHEALGLYHQNFKASAQLNMPFSMACVNIIAADTDEEAAYLSTSQQQFALGIIRGVRKPMPAPVKSMEDIWNPAEKAAIKNMMTYSFIGAKETIKEQLNEFIDQTRVDELIVVSHIHDHQARLRSYEIVGELKKPKNPFFDSEVSS